MRRRAWVVVPILVVLAAGLDAEPVRRRALLIGINDYSASRLADTRRHAVPERNWSNLDGALNDVALMRDLLVALYAFEPADIVALTDQQATRVAILRSLERLANETRRGDVVLFYFSGHGSQVRNSLSREADTLDESLVPADSRLGTSDVRDKELRSIFGRILARGARLTIVLDACHSGSAARGLDGGTRHRGIEPDARDVRDPSTGTPPEERGALILSAAEDFDLAFETLDERGQIRGAFTWALARAMRDAGTGEPASDTFLRARAWLHAERPAQQPVLAGSRDAQSRPLLGVRSDRRDRRALIAVEKATGAGTYVLQGGWASGVTVGSELRVPAGGEVRLEVTSLLGVARSEARLSRGTAMLAPGTLLELVTWAAPPSPPLRVWIPRADEEPCAVARALRDDAERRGIRWIDDPTEETPTHLLRRDGGGSWELLTAGRRVNVAAPSLAGVSSGASLFVQLPAPAVIAEALGGVAGIELTAGPSTADYILTGRLARDRVEYAWIRPLAAARDRVRSVLPLRTAWVAGMDELALRDALTRLRRVQGWHALTSPAGSGSHYRLAFRTADGALVQDGKLAGGKRYQLVLRERQPSSSLPLYARYVYAFAVDSDGRSVLLFPRPATGSVENLIPLTRTPGQPLLQPPPEVPLIGTRSFVVGEPYGVDTYFLLSTEEPLPNLAGLEWDGVRGPITSAMKHPLEELLAMTLAGTRGPDQALRTPPTWSIDKVTFESVPPKRSSP